MSLKTTISGALVALLLVLILPLPAVAKWVWTSDAGLVDTKNYETADPKELYDRAKAMFDAGKFGDAATEFSRVATYSSEETFREQASYMYGESLFQSAKYYKSYVAFEDYLSAYPRTPRLKPVIRRELDIGFKLMDGAKKSFLGLNILSGRSTGIEIIRKVLDNYPFEDFSAEYHFQLATKLSESGEPEDAALEWEAFLDRYAETSFAPNALFEKGKSQFKAFEGTDYDPLPLTNARRTFQDYLQHNPNGDRTKDAQGELDQISDLEAKKDFETAEFYVDRDHPESARVYFESVMHDYPQTTWAAKAEQRLRELEGAGK